MLNPPDVDNELPVHLLIPQEVPLKLKVQALNHIIALNPYDDWWLKIVG